MQNLRMSVEGDILRIEIDLVKGLKLTRSGRNVLIGSSMGTINLADENGVRPERINLSVWRTATERERRTLPY